MNEQIQTLFSTQKKWVLLVLLLVVLWGCSEKGTTGYAENEPTLDQSAGHEAKPEPLKFKEGIRSLLEDRKGNLWIGSQQEGVARFDGKNFIYFSEENGLSNNQVRRIQEDQDGVVWFENGEGLSSWDGENMTIHTDRDYSSKQNWQMAAGDLWFKSDPAIGVNELEGQPGVYRYDGEKLIFHVFPIPDFTWQWSPEEKDGGNYYSVVTQAQKGKDGTTWFGTYGAVIGYDGTSFTFINDESLGLNDETGHLHIRSILVDSKGNLWIGNNGIGVFLYDGEKTINFSEKHGLREQDTDGASLGQIFSIGEDRDGNIWFGTRHDGVWRFDGQSLSQITEEEGLDSKQGWAVYSTKRGDLWVVGGNPSGVYKFNGKTFDRMF